MTYKLLLNLDLNNLPEFNIVLNSSQSKDDLKIAFGEDTSFRLSGMKIHQDWNPRTKENDIALLLLDRPVNFGSNASPICLPSKDNSYADTEAIVAGKDL